MENYNNMMDSEYGNINYNNQMGDMSNQIQHQHQQTMAATAVEQQHQHTSINLMTSQAQPEIKDLHYNSRDTIITSNLQPQPHLDVYTHEMQQQLQVPIQNHAHDVHLQQQQQQEQVIQDTQQPVEYNNANASETSEVLKTDEVIDEGGEKHDLSNNNEVKMDTNDNDGETPEKNEEQIVTKDSGTLDDSDVKEDNKTETETKTEKKEEGELNPDQCRVCMAQENLTDIFQFDAAMRVCDIIMKICTTIRISEKDHLPHLICYGCVEKVKIAYDFKMTCENTDKELRKKMKRSKNKSRGTTEFVLINCPLSDSEEDEQQDDDEFKISESEESEPESDDSFEPPSKKKKTPSRKRASPRKRNSGTSSSSRSKSKRRSAQTTPTATSISPPASNKTPAKPTPGLKNVVYIEAPEVSSSSDDDTPLNKTRSGKSPSVKLMFDCSKCDKKFSSTSLQREHLKTHTETDLLSCPQCTKTFKLRHNLNQHLQKHASDEKRKEQQKKQKDVRAQQQKQKDMQKQKETHDKLKRQKQLADVKAKEQKPTLVEKKKKTEAPTGAAGTGRDLFKCVAPVTSTYWSDSFSE